MLKRYQVLINDWLASHIKEVAKKYDMSFSEVIRVLLCLQVGKNITILYKQCRCKMCSAEYKRIIKDKNAKKDLDTEFFHKFLSKLYFETRKAVECWEKQEKNKKLP